MDVDVDLGYGLWVCVGLNVDVGYWLWVCRCGRVCGCGCGLWVIAYRCGCGLWMSTIIVLRGNVDVDMALPPGVDVSHALRGKAAVRRTEAEAEEDFLFLLFPAPPVPPASPASPAPPASPASPASPVPPIPPVFCLPCLMFLLFPGLLLLFSISPVACTPCPPLT